MTDQAELQALSDAACGFTVERWIESLHEDVHGSVWTTKAELRSVLRAATPVVPAGLLAELDEFVDAYLDSEDWMGTGSIASGEMAEAEARATWASIRARLAASPSPRYRQGAVLVLWSGRRD